MTADVWKQQFDATLALYHEFLEWRHKILTRTAVALGAVAVAIRWLFEHQAVGDLGHERGVRVLAFAVGAIVPLVALLLDAVNQDVLRRCYEIGESVEAEQGIQVGGFFHLLAAHFHDKNMLSYRFILRVLYGVLAASFTAGGIVAAVA